MSEASINMIIKRFGYDGNATGHGGASQFSVPQHFPDSHSFIPVDQGRAAEQAFEKRH